MDVFVVGAAQSETNIEAEVSLRYECCTLYCAGSHYRAGQCRTRTEVKMIGVVLTACSQKLPFFPSLRMLCDFICFTSSFDIASKGVMLFSSAGIVYHGML